MKISIITPSYNPNRYIFDAIESVKDIIASLNDLDFDVRIEQIICDDASPSSEAQQLYDEISVKYEFCRIVHNAINQGPAGARNTAINEANGDWLGFVDADDKLNTDGFCALVKAAINNPLAQWVGGDSLAFFPDGKVIQKPLRLSQKNAKSDEAPFQFAGATLKNFLAGPPNLVIGSQIIQREIFDKVGGFDASLLCSEDWQLMLHLSCLAEFYYQPTIVLEFRRGEPSLTVSGRTLRTKSLKPIVKIFFDGRFKSTRRYLRWTFIAECKYYSDCLYEMGCQTRSAWFLFLAWLVAPEEMSLFAKSVHRLIKRHSGH